MEYAVSVWHPHLVRDIDAVESVQRRATKIIPGFNQLPYEERLRRLSLPSLIYRRYRGDMIHTFKYLHKLYDSPNHQMLKPRENQTRGHSLKLSKPRCRLQIKQFSFSHRVVDTWNSLPEVNAKSVNSFKNLIDNHWAEAPFKYDYKSQITPSNFVVKK